MSEDNVDVKIECDDHKLMSNIFDYILKSDNIIYFDWDKYYIFRLNKSFQILLYEKLKIEADDHKNTNAMFMIAIDYNGYSLRKNDCESMRYYQLCENVGNYEASFQLGRHYWYGYYNEPSFNNCSYGTPHYNRHASKAIECTIMKDEAIKHFKKASELGSADAMYSLGNYYFFGEACFYSLYPFRSPKPEFKPDIQMGLHYYKMSANKWYGNALIDLARMYRVGFNVELNNVEAFKYYRMAAEKDVFEGYVGVCDMYYSSEAPVEKDSAKLINYIKSHMEHYAENNHNLESHYDNIIYQLIGIYRDGKYIEPDNVEMLKLATKLHDDHDELNTMLSNEQFRLTVINDYIKKIDDLKAQLDEKDKLIEHLKAFPVTL